MDSEVLIVGGGPTGLISGILLSMLGVKATILEKHPEPLIHPKAMFLNRRTMEIMRRIGLEKELREVGNNETGHVNIWAGKAFNGEELGRSEAIPDTRRFSVCGPLHIPQSAVEIALRLRASHEPHLTLLTGWEVTGVQAHSDRVEIVARDREKGTSHTFAAPWVIAADGERSLVRESVGITREGPGDMGRFLNVYFRLNTRGQMTEPHSVLYEIFQSDLFEYFVSVNHADLWLMHHFLDEGETPEQYSHQTLQEIIRKATGIDRDPEILSVSPWMMSPKTASAWRKGRVLLVGDASARLSPAGGLGLNTGVHSAMNLTWKLAAVIEARAGEDLLDTYHEERHDLAARTSRMSAGFAGEVFQAVQLGLKERWDDLRAFLARSGRRGSNLGLDVGWHYDTGAFLPEPEPLPPLENPMDEARNIASNGAMIPHVMPDQRHPLIDLISLHELSLVLADPPRERSWVRAAAAHGVSLKPVLGTQHKPDTETLKALRLAPNGGMIVRPDGIVAARFQDLASADWKGLAAKLRLLHA